MMTRKHYNKAVEIIKSLSLSTDKQKHIRLFVEFFKNDNPRFDKNKFIDACNK